MARAATVETGSETGERILAAALDAFSEKGYDGASTREIAMRAGVTLGLLQYHFGGKLKLWRAAVDRAFSEMELGLRSILEDPARSEPRERLRRLIRAHVEFAARRPEFIRLMHDEGKRRGPRMRWLVDRHVKPMFDVLEPLIAEVQAAGVLPAGIPPVHFVYVLVGSVGLFFHQAEECKRVAGIDPSAPESVEAHGRAVEYLFLGTPNEEKLR